jgi:hypothetical protein
MQSKIARSEQKRLQIVALCPDPQTSARREKPVVSFCDGNDVLAKATDQRVSLVQANVTGVQGASRIGRWRSSLVSFPDTIRRARPGRRARSGSTTNVRPALLRAAPSSSRT